MQSQRPQPQGMLFTTWRRQRQREHCRMTRQAGRGSTHCTRHCASSWLRTVSVEKFDSAALAAIASRSAPGAAARCSSTGASSDSGCSSVRLPSLAGRSHSARSCSIPSFHELPRVLMPKPKEQQAACAGSVQLR